MDEVFAADAAHPIESKHRRAADFVRRFVRRSEEYREPHIELALKSRETYECWSSQSKSVIQRANLKLPYGYTIIETQVPQLVEMFAKERPLIKMIAREPSDMQWQDDMTDFMDMQLDAMKFSARFIPWCKSVLLDGTAIAKVPYKYVEQVVQQRTAQQDPVTGETFYIKQPVRSVKHDGPDFEPINIVDFFPDWRVRSPGDIQAMRGCVHRTYKTFDELRATGRYINLDELEDSINIKGACEDAMFAKPYWKARQDGNSMDVLNDNEEQVKERDLIEIWEYWGVWSPKDDGKFEEYILVVANGDVTIRCEENFYDCRFKPFIATVNVPRDYEFYGIPELVAVKGAIKEATSLRNARLDQVNLGINRMFVVDRTAGIKTNTLYSRPNGVILTNDINGIKPLDAPDVSGVSSAEVQALQLEIQNATGLVNSAPAISQLAKTFGRSATGAQMVQSFASSRIGLKARLMAELAIKPLAHIMMMTNKQFVTDEQWVRVSDPARAAQNPFTVLPPDAFYSSYDLEITTNLENSNEMMFQNLQAFIQLAQAAEGTQPGTINWDPIFQATGRALLGRKVRNFVRTPEERQQLMYQQLAAEQAANAQAGASAPQPNAQPGATRM